MRQLGLLPPDRELEGLALCAPVHAWFVESFARPTEPQRRAWPAIARGSDVLLAAPTGSGKTLAAFLVILDRLVRRALAGELEDALEAVYVSPLRALSTDIHRNLEQPLAGIRAAAERMGLALPEIRAAVRTGDTPASARQSMLRRPPHILVTTPESLYVMLTAPRARELFRTARSAIVDEIHALARDKRGSHLALSLERLERLAAMRPARIGLSATQRPIDAIARLLAGGQGADACEIVDLGHQRDLELAIEVPRGDDLQAVASHELWDDLLDVLAGHVRAHRTTLVFVNTRRLAERLAHRLEERLGTGAVAAHHGSLSRERRLAVEQKLKDGRLSALVATASLELGIDVGHIDLVCQVGSPRSIATFLQRIGRSGHALGLRPRGRLFPTSRDELAECAALVRAARAGRLDRVYPPRAPLDILAQQIVAAVANEEWSEDDLFERMRRAAPYRALERADFDAVLEMLAHGFETPRGRRAQHLHRDRLTGRVRARRGALLAALTSGGAIPETADYRVVLHPDDVLIGSVDEDWAIESMAGDVFLLGSHTWRIRRVESGVVRVEDAHGAPPTIPFWMGEAPGRTEELSAEVSALRVEVAARQGKGQAARAQPDPRAELLAWLQDECGLDASGADQLARYVAAQCDAVGLVPSCDDLLAERFFDEAGGLQLVLHTPWGTRINRGLGLALRKRFCRSFNQELQAAASDDAVVLSLGNPQTFPLDSLLAFLSPHNVAEVLEQAMLGSPLFTARWRWNATRALAVLRTRGGTRVPFPIQRMQADDLLVAAFPEQTACQENVRYPIEIPDHPLVRQTLRDCLTEAADVEGLERLVGRLARGEARLHALDTVEPSPFAHEILNARPYAFLDDAPLEERRTRAVALRHVLPESGRDLARLDPAAIERVRAEAAPLMRDADELADVLADLVLARTADLPGAAGWLEALGSEGRALRFERGGSEFAAAVERLPELQALLGDPSLGAQIPLPPALAERRVERDAAVDLALRGHLALLGPVTCAELAARSAVSDSDAEAALARLEARGIALRGHFDPALEAEQFCDRSLLARIHRYTLAALRREIEPVSAQSFALFLLRWQHVHPETRLAGEGGLLEAIRSLSGFDAAAAAWEAEILSARIEGYRPELLDRLCLGGSVAWLRLAPALLEPGARPSRATPIALVCREQLDELLHDARALDPTPPRLRGEAESVLEALRRRGALFARELEAATGLLPVQVEDGLKELVAQGMVTCDGFAPLRRLLSGGGTAARRRAERARRAPVQPAGRWGLLEPLGPAADEEARAESAALRVLRRYGVVFRDLLAREFVPAGWRALHRALRRLEARGEVRGGRFVSGFTGEQFALPQAIPALRRERSREREGRELRISSSDPLNLSGILGPGPRVAARPGRWLVLRDGWPVAVEERGIRTELDPEGARGSRARREGPPSGTGSHPELVDQ
jgi:ATP-dependent Lhr-like helicase